MLTRATDDATTMTMTATATNTSATTPLCPSLYRSIAFWAVSEPSCGPRPSVLLLLSKPSFPNLRPPPFPPFPEQVRNHVPGKRSGNMIRTSSKIAPRGPERSPRWPNRACRRPQSHQRSLKMAPRRPQQRPQTPRERSKTRIDSLRTCQESPKTAQESSMRPRRRPKRPPTKAPRRQIR